MGSMGVNNLFVASQYVSDIKCGVNFDLYQGKNPAGKAKYEEVFGKCASPIILFLELPAEKRNLAYNFFLIIYLPVPVYYLFYGFPWLFGHWYCQKKSNWKIVPID